ncbi:methylmalonyl-CoA mutase, partial [Streptomyces sp. SID8455]|nr:methylmalonyl-CoA mutase [Streptomyces sp. SID8455]
MTVQPADGLSPAAVFPDPSHDQWQSLVEGVLRKSGKEVSGSAAEEALSTTLEDGLTTRPLYTAHDTSPDTGFPGFAPFTRGSRAEGNAAGGWDVRQRHALSDPARLNEAVLGDLENGVTSLWLTVGGPAGIPVGALARALDGVYLDLAPVVLDAPADLDAAATELLRLYEERGVAKGEARGTLGADPLGHEARTGIEADLTAAVRWARVC